MEPRLLTACLPCRSALIASWIKTFVYGYPALYDMTISLNCEIAVGYPVYNPMLSLVDATQLFFIITLLLQSEALFHCLRLGGDPPEIQH
jgi:hypothetical protein